MSFLTNLLPGLRQLRTPLAAGLIWLFAGWLAFAPAIPDRATATGVIADVYRLSAAVGKVPTLAAAAFAAFLVGVLSARISEGLADAASGIGDRFAYEIARPELVDRLFALRPGASIKRRQLAALRHAVMHRLLDRYRWDEQLATDRGPDHRFVQRSRRERSPATRAVP